jgi:3-deoxy-D-manno-octulosonic-acid transferase
VDHPVGEARVILLDTYGDLGRAYSTATLAFVGASLVDIGGHNPFEAAAQGAYVVMGPYHHVAKQEVEDLKAAGSLELVASQDQIEKLLDRFLSDPAKMKESGTLGQSVWRTHTGTADKIVKLIYERYQL